jgi:hypothetical protein
MNNARDMFYAPQDDEHWCCPYCGADYGTDPDPHPYAIPCCGEVGHLQPAGDNHASL